MRRSLGTVMRIASGSLDPSQIRARFQGDATARGARAGSRQLASGLECLQICYDIRDLIRVETELRHGRMIGNKTFGQAPAQAFDREFEVQCAEGGRDGERAVADPVDGVALRAMHAYECQAPLRCRRLSEGRFACA
jgi:hypothetical protein